MHFALMHVASLGQDLSKMHVSDTGEQVSAAATGTKKSSKEIRILPG
jgi:hypothetical protein